MEQVVAGNQQAGDCVREERVERQSELHLQSVVPSDELSAQRQAEIEERERVNAALVLEQEIDRRVLQALSMCRHEFDQILLDALRRNWDRIQRMSIMR